MARSPRTRRMGALTGRLVGVAVALAAVACGPGRAMASNTEEDDHYDARVQGYEPKAEVLGASGALQWLMLVAAGVVCVGVVFKDAKRTHLD